MPQCACDAKVPVFDEQTIFFESRNFSGCWRITLPSVWDAKPNLSGAVCRLCLAVGEWTDAFLFIATVPVATRFGPLCKTLQVSMMIPDTSA